ncbi:PocR ligand-binding domain-containing protein [Gemmiger formicilis]|nr:PocR ligand-binding domain-containing protein [Gemmiger formicilis]
MGTVFNKKELLVLLQDFHCLTGLRSAVFDSYGIEVLAYPPELPAYCRLIRSVPDGKTGCYLCDQAACRKATRQKQTIIYPCHAGLIEVITPVQIDGAVVGFCC